MKSGRPILIAAGGIAALALAAAVTVWATMLAMPGASHKGPLPPATAAEAARAGELRRIATALAGTVGERTTMRPDALEQAARTLEAELTAAGLAVESQPYTVDGVSVRNVTADLRGTEMPDQIIVLGANYDSMRGSPGADTNASGAAALATIAAEVARRGPARRTIRFAFFVNKEPPHFQTERMGSVVHARSAKERGERIVGMLNLQSLGIYSDAAGSQRYPRPLDAVLPDVGDFVAFVGDLESRRMLRRAIAGFRAAAAFPSIGAALPAATPGVGWSDHWAFWGIGVPAVMVSDTAMFRYDAFGTAQDTVDRLDFDRLARVVTGLHGAVTELVDGP